MEIISYKPGTTCAALDRIRSRSLQMNPDLVARVAGIVDAVRERGDAALFHYTREFDGVTLDRGELRVAADFIKDAASRADATTVEAFRHAIRNVRTFHEQQREAGWLMTLDGARVGQRVLPIASAGLYVPGGLAAYPSTIIMNAVPAQVAGVPRIAIATPPGTLERTPVVAAVIAELGIEEVYRVGGAQAIAALAFGTESIPRVDKIAGPGNIYVAIAKKLVYGSAGIDSIAGPTEVVVLADDTADPRFIAADLLAQAEHDEDASAICITTSMDLAEQVAREVRSQLTSLERRQIAEASIDRYGAVFVVDSIEAGCELVNLIAPEHLELMTSDDERAAGLIDNAGAIFFGRWSAEPVGDYIAGPNHVLPTVGTSRFSSPLGVYDFLKRQSVIHYTREAIENNAGVIATMADAEGLTAHKLAVMMRKESRTEDRRSPEAAPRSDAPVASQSNALSRIKPAVRAITAYTLKPHRTAIKINQNENPFDMPVEIKQEVGRRLGERRWSRYPDFVPTQLLEALAEFAGWRPEGTLAGNGSNELIQATLMVTVGTGSRVVVPEPTFTLYGQIVTVLGGEVLSVPLTPEFRFDVDAIRRRAREGRAGVVIICSPNNPTGCRIEDDDLVRLAREFDGIVVVDEAYHEFSGRTVVPLLKELPNLIVLRTFSKAMAMAGLRVGYLLASPELAREVHKATLPYNLNFVSATAAEVACRRFDLLKPAIDMIISERERLGREISGISGMSTVPSAANFMLVRSPVSPRKLFEELRARDILVRDVSHYPMLEDYLRVSVGSREENDRLIQVLKGVIEHADAGETQEPGRHDG
ncbi:MAG TPA: histidinol dehydrogenase [Blastocatellia bacterium]|nr:histidinol dehydrogenase [Blastocatellia bacterium]